MFNAPNVQPRFDQGRACVKKKALAHITAAWLAGERRQKLPHLLETN